MKHLWIILLLLSFSVYAMDNRKTQKQDGKQSNQYTLAKKYYEKHKKFLLGYTENDSVIVIDPRNSSFITLPKVKTLDESAGNFFADQNQKLEAITISCILNYMPFWVLKLKNLKNLQFSSPSLKALPNKISSANLTQLNLSDCDFDAFPKEVLNIKTLEKLNLSYNNLQSVPSDITKLSNLKIGFFHGNNIDDLPDISSMVKLRTLTLFKQEHEMGGMYDVTEDPNKPSKNLLTAQKKYKNLLPYLDILLFCRDSRYGHYIQPTCFQRTESQLMFESDHSSLDRS